MPSLTAHLKHNSDLSKRILQAVSSRVKMSEQAYEYRYKKWRENEEAALAYIHEDALSAKRSYQRDKLGKPEYTKLKVPYSYGILMASHTYWTTVFLSRTPINQFQGRHGETEQQVQALEALINYQVRTGEMLVPWYIWLLDAGKYGLGVLSIDWTDNYSVISTIEEVEENYLGLLPTGKKVKKKISRRVKGYSGNTVSNIRPYDFYPDPRVAVRFFQKGEFVAVRMQLGWNQVLKRTDQGYYNEQVIKLIEKGLKNTTETRRTQGSPEIHLPTDLSTDAGWTWKTEKSNRDMAKANIEVIECTVELVPNYWGLGEGKYPEKWVFTVTSNYEYVLGAQPLGANHDKFPFAVIEYEPEGYSLTSRGISEVLKPVNDTMDWLINSHLYNVRKTLNDQFVVDPSQIEISDLENPFPGGAIRLSPAAYGRGVKDALAQLPINDVTRTHLQDMGAMLTIGQRAVGVNDQLTGMINPTGRRSATEVRTGAGFGVNRLKTTSEFFSAMGWDPMAMMLVANSQQYYDEEQKFRIVGDLAREAGEEFMMVRPEDIMGHYDFIAFDGTQPVDRLMQVQMWTNLFAQLRNFPDIMMKYDIGRIFEWVAQLGGIKNISQFRVDLQPEEELALLAQKGDLVPIGGGKGGGSGSGQAGAAGGNLPLSTGNVGNFG